MNRWFIALIILPLIVAILPEKSLCTITIITRGAPLVILVAVGHGVCYKIFGIWNNRLISNPLWNLICGLLEWFTTRPIYLWPEIFLDMSLLDTLVTAPYPLQFSLWRLLKSTCFKASLVFLYSLLYKELIGYEILLWYDIHITHMIFLDKFRYLLVLLYIPQT